MDNMNNNYGYGSFLSNYGLDLYEQNQNLDNGNMGDQGDYQNLPGYGAQAFQTMQNGINYLGEQFQNVVPFNPLQQIGTGVQFLSDTIQDVIPFNPLQQMGNGVHYLSDTIQDVIPFNPDAIKKVGVGIKEKISNIFGGFIANAKQLASSVVSSRLFKIVAVVVAIGLIVTGVAVAKTLLTIGCIVLAVLLAKRIFDAVAKR